MAQSGLAGFHSGSLEVISILGMSSSSNSSVLGQQTLKQLVNPVQLQWDVELYFWLQRVADYNGMCKIVLCNSTDLGYFINDNTIDTTLNWTYQVIVHQAAVYCLVKDQDVHFAGDWVVVSNGTCDNRELIQAQGIIKTQNDPCVQYHG